MQPENTCKPVLRTLTVLGVLLFTFACAQIPLNPVSDHGQATQTQPPDNFLNNYLHAQCQTPGFNTLDSIVRVATATIDGGDGSGVVVGPNLVLTAAHVLEGETTGLVYIGQEYRMAMVVGYDHQADLALLSVGTDSLVPIAIGRESLRQNESVWAVGYPLARQRTTTQGEYFSYRFGGLLTSAAINAGSSGGGLLHCENGQFKLAGMIRSYMAYYRQGERVMLPERSISVPAETISAFINLHGIEL